MPLTVLTGKNGRIDPFSIVPHAQSKLIIVITDFNLNLPCLGVLKRAGDLSRLLIQMEQTAVAQQTRFRGAYPRSPGLSCQQSGHRCHFDSE